MVWLFLVKNFTPINGFLKIIEQFDFNSIIQSLSFYMNLFYVLDGKRFEKVDIGTSLERVLRYYTLNGKLTEGKNENGVFVGIGVHPELKAIGIKEIEIYFKNGQVAFIFEGT